MKVRLLAGLAAVAMAVGFAPAAMATGEIGARLSPVPLIFEDQPWVQVTSLSTVPVSVALEWVSDDPSGWSLETEAFTLAAYDEVRRVTVTSAGPEPAILQATVRALDVPAGVEATSVVLQTTARHPYWYEGLSPLPWSVGLLAAVIAAYTVRRLSARRRTR